jgi:hypothetical protein
MLVMLLYVSFLLKCFYCADIYIDVGGSTGSGCGSSVSSACSTFAAAFSSRSGSTFFFVFWVLLDFRDSFYFGAGNFQSTTYYSYSSGTFTHFIGSTQSDGIPATHLNTSASSYGFAFSNSNAQFSFTNFNLTYTTGAIVYVYGTSTVCNVTNCRIVRGSTGLFYVCDLFVFCFS